MLKEVMRRSVISSGRPNDRGVALIIVLLVTALLIALIFEFAYGTRISLRAAVNFRNSTRAYYLARSGVNLLGLLLSDDLKNGKLQDRLQQPEPGYDVSNLLGMNDAVLRVQWDDEGGKINVSSVVKPVPPNTNPALPYNRLVILFTNRGVSQDKLDAISDWMREQQRSSFYLLTEFHQFLSDEEFGKIQDAITVAPVTRIDINTASLDVLRSIGLDAGMAERILQRQRSREFFTSDTQISDFLGQAYTMASGQLTSSSTWFKVRSSATVGGVNGYTKIVEAIIVIRADGSGADVKYWRAM